MFATNCLQCQRMNYFVTFFVSYGKSEKLENIMSPLFGRWSRGHGHINAPLPPTALSPREIDGA